jgi:uncharacterized membrane protein
MAKFFSEEEHSKIIAAIKEAEKQTSGEIRLFIEPRCKVEVLDRAAFIFQQLVYTIPKTATVFCFTLLMTTGSLPF